MQQRVLKWPLPSKHEEKGLIATEISECGEVGEPGGEMDADRQHRWNAWPYNDGADEF